jgi:hypothetical protein
MVMSSPICDRKWWNFSVMCFVRGLILGDFTRSTHPLLSSKIAECVIVSDNSSPATAASSSNNLFIGMRSRMAWDNAMYSASVVDKAIYVCSFDAQSTGHPQNVITYPILDFIVLEFSATSGFHNPAKSAST